ncbi:YchE family NAAT transporter [Buchnera aphidicola]|uniref:YchE family NAAT transporter n=1 Tax=Buchnera aphidicola TaxID=9 RepID=UPI0022376195|nr:YchE family NAAT transporter [Buchnera aphidicola]MCW5197681.1 YchE family NAAT transporter [Buchnera aphidicola (Chaitophorus viminalis)]
MNILNFDFTIYIKFFISLVILINPIGMIPIFLSMTNHFSDKEKNRINLVANFSAFLILLISLFFGHSILKFFAISISSVKISGGLLILTIAFSMINNHNTSLYSKKKYTKKNNIQRHNIAIIPLAMPLIAGPGAISTTIIWSIQNSSLTNMIFFSIVIFIFFMLCYFVFRISPFFMYFFGKTGMEIITKIMGLLLMSVGIELITSGIRFILDKNVHDI